MNNIDKIYNTTPEPRGFARGYLEYLTQVLKAMDCDAIAHFAELLLTARKHDRNIFFIGNGGSAATASHFANDLSIGTRSWDKPFRVIALTDNAPIITAIGNDFGYDEVFLMQLKTQMRPGDVVVAISASGNSTNVIKAIEYANLRDCRTVGLTGFDGGKLKSICHLNLHVPSLKGEYGPVEDVHMILDHLIGAYLIKLGEAEGKHV